MSYVKNPPFLHWGKKFLGDHSIIGIAIQDQSRLWIHEDMEAGKYY